MLKKLFCNGKIEKIYVIFVFVFLVIPNVMAGSIEENSCDIKFVDEPIEMLRECFESNNRKKIVSAIKILSIKTNDQHAQEILLRIWNREDLEQFDVNRKLFNDDAIRLATLNGLIINGISNGDGYIDFVHSKIDNPDPFIRSMGAEVLGHIGDVRAVNTLSLLVKQDEFVVAFSAIHSLYIICLNGPSIDEAKSAMYRLYEDRNALEPMIYHQLGYFIKRMD